MKKNTSKTNSPLKVAFKKPRYFVDMVSFNNRKIEVDFTINNDNGHTEYLELASLARFAEDQNLNEWQADGKLNGGQVKIYGILDAITYVLDNLYDVVESYLMTMKIGLSAN